MGYFVKMDFKSMKDSPLDTFAGAVLKNLAGNPTYESVKTLVEKDFREAVTAYSAALIASRTGGKPATSVKNSKRATLVDVLDTISRHVELICNGDESMILATGFEVGSTEKSTVSEIAKGNIISAKRADGPCEAEVLIEPLEGANQYAFEWSTDGKSWHNGTYSSKRKVILTTTFPKSDTFIRYRGLGLKERKGPWSDPVSLFIV